MLTATKQNKTFFIYLSLLIYWVILFVATSLPAQDLPKTGVSDKIEHFTAYAVLSFLLYLTMSVQGRYKILSKNPFLSTLIICAVYGALDELHQLFIPGRTCDIHDFFADFIGVLIGLFLVTRKRIRSIL